MVITSQKSCGCNKFISSEHQVKTEKGDIRDFYHIPYFFTFSQSKSVLGLWGIMKTVSCRDRPKTHVLLKPQYPMFAAWILWIYRFLWKELTQPYSSGSFKFQSSETW